MEKEEVKEEKKEKKEVEFKGRVEKASFKRINNAIDAIAKIGMFLFALMLVFSIVFSTLSTIEVIKKTREEVANKDHIVEYLATINGDSDEHFKERLKEEEKWAIVAFDIAVPSFIIISILVLLIAVCKRTISFIKDIKLGNKLFTREKLKESANIINSLLVVGTVYVVFLASFYTVIWFIVLDIALTIAFLLFRRCVEYEENLNGTK